MSNFKDFTRAIAGIASALKGINTVVDDIPVPGSGAGGIDYSETEQDTGLKWIDGNELYCITKKISGSASGNWQEENISSITDIADILFLKECFVDIPSMSGVGHIVWPISQYNSSSISAGYEIQIDNDKFVYKVQGLAAFDLYATFYYTKASE